MKKCVVNKQKCKEVASVMKNFSFEHPEAKLKPQDLEKELFYLFIVVGICHQINWNFLMKALKKIQNDYPAKFTPFYMQNVSDKEVSDWLSAYPKKRRLGRRYKRGELIRDMCKVLVRKYKGKVKNLLEAANYKMGGNDGFYALLKDFRAFGEDPLRKKSAVLIDLIDRFGLWGFDDWNNYIPPVDYHIVRIALRNGVAEVEDTKLLEKLKNRSPVIQEEDTIIRSTVIEALNEISKISGRHTKDLQGFYWALGRECCDPDASKCHSCDFSKCSVFTYMNIKCKGKCPLASVCKAAGDEGLLRIKEQNFATTFY